jgi:AbrB family looped-hinge helix DNA binding protein
VQRASVISSKGQLVIPSDLRRKYGLKQGVRVIFIEHEGCLTLEPSSYAEIAALRGSLRGYPLEASLIEERRAARKRENT